LIFAIGDIHGQVTMLRKLLDKLSKLPLRSTDSLLFIGDYVDRGEDSAAVIETLIELGQQRPDTVFLRGNHEQLMLDARDSAPPEVGGWPGAFVLSEQMLLWLSNGGEETMLSYSKDMDESDFLHWWDVVPESHWEFMRQTRMEHISGRYQFVHAGVLPGGEYYWEGRDQSLDPRLWIREPFLSSTDDFGGRIVVFGHTPQRSGSILVRKNKIGIDTGAVFGGPLTAVGIDPEVKPRKFHSPQIVKADHSAAV
jgi:serine/threonine protein phosphatase 1